MIIQNFEKLSKTFLRKSALLIAEAGLEAIDTRKIIGNVVQLKGGKVFIDGDEIILKRGARIFVVGVGKCANEAAAAFEKILGDKLSGGAIIDIRSAQILRKIKSFVGTHPLPSAQNIKAAKETVSLLEVFNENDFVIFIVSGGGSALLCLPENSYEDEIKIVRELMRAGADIQEINTVRKHLSYARGGFLAKYACPARGVALIFSDVPGDDIQFISSGPTVCDRTTIRDAEKILKRYGINRLYPMKNCGLIETPKEKKYFKKIKNIVIASNKIALEAMAVKANELGFRVKIRTTRLTGRTRDASKKIMEELHKVPPKTALLYGGETTVVVHGQGKGGRNMDFALSALSDIRENEIIAAVASDGRDNSDFAGAICDKITREKAGELGLNIMKFLEENNEYPFFEKVGDYILTGPTGSNVSDLIIAIKE